MARKGDGRMTDGEFQLYVLEKLDKVADELSQLRGKSSVWGAVGGVIASLLVAILDSIFRHSTKG